MMAEDKKILEAPKKVVDGLVEVFEGLAQMFSGVSDQLEKIPLLTAAPEDEIPHPLAEVPALSEKKGGTGRSSCGRGTCGRGRYELRKFSRGVCHGG